MVGCMISRALAVTSLSLAHSRMLHPTTNENRAIFAQTLPANISMMVSTKLKAGHTIAVCCLRSRDECGDPKPVSDSRTPLQVSSVKAHIQSKILSVHLSAISVSNEHDACPISSQIRSEPGVFSPSAHPMM
jgi:hypothetical protein